MAYPKVKNKIADSWSSQARTNSLILIAAMLFFGWISAQDVKLLLSSCHWQPIESQIIQSKINKGNRGGPDSPWIEFRYTVDKRTYASDQVDFGEWSHGDVPTYISNFPIGKTVTAYYNPDNPEQAVLNKTGSLFGNLLMCLVTWGLAAMTIYYRFFKLAKN
ncbi:MAG: DUF3592 domain-containing protein [Methylococcales bacterium]|jgi:hypothetical protein|nr:DUF3592 domain-containing protein [Methylococcales bacterium]MBT7445242.1 DUF3592 domain-containing protein [Methylococcales bacterium]